MLALFELSPYFYLIASLIFLGNNYKTNFSNKIKLPLCATQAVMEQVRASFPPVLCPRALDGIRKTVLVLAFVLTEDNSPVTVDPSPCLRFLGVSLHPPKPSACGGEGNEEWE